MIPELDELTVYVFVRNDLGPTQEDVQSNHACLRVGWQLGLRFPVDPTPNPYLVTKEKLNAKSLVKLARKFPELDVPHYVMIDTDVDPSSTPTALAVFPLNDEQRELVRKYPLRKYGEESGGVELAQKVFALSPEELMQFVVCMRKHWDIPNDAKIEQLKKRLDVLAKAIPGGEGWPQ